MPAKPPGDPTDRQPQFQAIYDAYLPRVYGYVAARVDDQQEAEDLVSDIFVKVMQNLGQVRGQHAHSLTTWIFTIARHRIADHYRRGNGAHLPYDLLEDSASDEPTPDINLLNMETGAMLRALVAALPARRQEVVIMKFFAGLRNQEIAAVLGLDERTIASHLSRGLRDLHQQYQAMKENDHVDR